MAKLDYKFTNDTLFKMLFVEYQDLLKSLVAVLLDIPVGNIEAFDIMNPELPPDMIGDKLCRLDINMMVDGKLVDLEVQVENEKGYPERSLYYWAREYSSALKAGGAYNELPPVVVISILAFNLFDCEEYHSEFMSLEVNRHTPLTDRQDLHYFELPKLPKAVNAENIQELWLALFNAGTEEDLTKIEETGVPEMAQAIKAFRALTAEPSFQAIERMREDALHDEVWRTKNAEARGEERGKALERAKWLSVVSDKEAALADKDAKLADKDSALAEQATIIAQLRAQLERGN